jgi:PAS domain S-box-containing protein
MAVKDDTIRRVAQHAAATLVYVDTDLRVRFANRHCHELLGHAPDALHGRQLAELADTATMRFARQHVAEAEKGTAVPREYALRHKDGTKRFVQVSAVADRDPAGRSIGYVLSTSDNGGRAGAAELQAAQQRFSLALDVAEAGFWVWDLAAQSEHHSKEFKALLGYREADFAAQFSFFGAIHPDDGKATGEALTAAMRHGGRFDREFRLRCADGRWRWIRGIGQALPDANGASATRFQGVAHDISRRKQTELELREAQLAVQSALDRCSALAQDLDQRTRLDRVRRELLAAANHALRTPLASIIAALELLQDVAAPPSGATPESLLAIALENAGRLAVVVEQWLDMERINIGATLMRSLPLELEAMVAGLVDQLDHPRAAAVRFKASAAGRARVSGDPARLRQAIAQLISGAVERSAPAGTVEVELAVHEQRAVLTVNDEASHAAPGSDLGLLLAEAIVKGSGGTLRVEQREGKGTLVAVELPCLREEADV